MNSLLNIMVAETEQVADNSAGLLGDVAQQSRSLRERLDDSGKIVTVDSIDWSTVVSTSLCAVDGASASKQLQSGDLISVGSTLSDGQNSRKAVTDKRCAYGYLDFRVHSSDNTTVVNSMRALTEISALGDAPHDISIIDGAMLNNYLSVLLALQQNKRTAQPIINFLKQEEQADAFYQGVRKIFSSKNRKEGNQRVIALAKSDSSSTMVKSYLGRSSAEDLKDKLVASMVLKPGEMMAPLPLEATPLKPELLETNNASTLKEWNMLAFNNWNLNSLDLAEKEIVFKILHVGYGMDKALEYGDLSVFNQYTYLVKEKNLHFTYYKPRQFMMGEQALRVEFSLMNGNKDALREIGAVLPILEADIVSGGIKEPFSQYMVDRYAKEAISKSMVMLEGTIRNKLNAAGQESFHSLSSYRS